MNIKKTVIIAILSSILFVQEQLLSFIPNIQFTFLLLVVYSKVLGLKPTICIILIHVLLDNLIVGTMTPLIMVPMLIGYLMVPITLEVFFKNVKLPPFLALFGILFACFYSFCFVITNLLFLDINIATYIIADIPFTVILAGCNFLTILWVYDPLSKVLTKLINAYYN